MIIGEALVRNGRRSTELVILNAAPVLRGKFIADPTSADAWSAMHYALQELLLSKGRHGEAHRALVSSYSRLIEERTPHRNALEDVFQAYLRHEFYAAIKTLMKARDLG